MTLMIPFYTILVIMALGLVLTVLIIKSTFKDAKKAFSLFKEGIPHAAGENSQNEGKQWKKIKISLLPLAVIILILSRFLRFSGSSDSMSIALHLIVLLALDIYLLSKNSRFKVLKNDTAVRQTRGTITKEIVLSQKILFFTYSKGHTYEYEFQANGLKYKGIDGETNRDVKKRGKSLENPVTVLYESERPENSYSYCGNIILFRFYYSTLPSDN